MLLAACFGSVGKMQTMDTIRNHGGDHINLFLRQFCIGVQKPRKAVHYKIRMAPTFSYWDGSMFASLICSRMASRRCCVKRFMADAGTTPR